MVVEGLQCRCICVQRHSLYVVKVSQTHQMTEERTFPFDTFTSPRDQRSTEEWMASFHWCGRKLQRCTWGQRGLVQLSARLWHSPLALALFRCWDVYWTSKEERTKSHPFFIWRVVGPNGTWVEKETVERGTGMCTLHEQSRLDILNTQIGLIKLAPLCKATFFSPKLI